MQFIWEFFAEPLRRADQERRDYLATLPAGRIDWETPVVLFAAAILLTFRSSFYWLSYGSALSALESMGGYVSLAQTLFDTVIHPLNSSLARQAYWALWQCLLYVVIPIVITKIVLRKRLSDYGLKLQGMTSFWWAYLLMFLVMVPPILFVSTTESFQHTYPFFKPERVASALQHNAGIPPEYWPRFWIWQAFYAVQFVSLEFFFRGFMLHGTRRQFGAYAIFAMTIPYCMIHFGKPLPETLGAIAAGIILGFMSLKTRSIWLGAALHIGVAVTMDLAALAQK